MGLGVLSNVARTQTGMVGQRPVPIVPHGWSVVQLRTGTRDQENQVLQWAWDHSDDEWRWSPYNGGNLDNTGLHFQFKSADDAVLFKMTWAGRW